MVDMSTHKRPGWAALMTPSSPSSTDDTCAPSTTMLITTSLRCATSAGVESAVAPCSEAHVAALPSVCVQTASGTPACAMLAAIREPMIPRPRKPTTPTPPAALLSLSCMPESSPTWRFDAQPLAGVQLAGALGWQQLPVEQVAPARPGGSALRATWRVAPALCDQRELHLAPRSELAHDAFPAAVQSGSAGASTQGVRAHAQREFPLEGLDRGVHGVAHRDMHRARSVCVRAGALATAQRLVVGEPGLRERGSSAGEGQVVHGALTLGASERAQHQIGDAR